MTITRKEYLKGRDVTYANEFTNEISNNVDKTLEIINRFFKDYSEELIVNSGWRPSQINSTTQNSAKNSTHLQALAIDVADVTPYPVWNYVLKNLQLAEQLGIYFENKNYCPTWTHLQIVAPKSKKRIYIPNSNPQPTPLIWDNQYDHKHDK